MAALVIVSSLFQIACSMRLSWLRRVITSTASGIIIILLVITIVASIFGNIVHVVEDAHGAATPVCVRVTLFVTLGLILYAPGAWKAWAPLIGLGMGWITAAAFGIYDIGPVNQAHWVGLHLAGWPALGLEFGRVFWSLLPTFLFMSIIVVCHASSTGLATQRVSWRGARAVDYQRVQGGAVGIGMGTLLAGLVGAMPVTVSPRGIFLIQQTGRAYRYIGVLTGLVLIAVAFFPKFWSLLIGIPSAVTAIFLIVIICPLILEGMILILRDGPDFRKGLVVGISLSMGLGFQFNLINLPTEGLWGPMLQNGVTAGSAVVVILTLITQYSGRSRRRRLNTELSANALPTINAFLENFSEARQWGSQMTARLQSVAEEVTQILAQHVVSRRGTGRLLIIAGSDGDVAELEFISASGNQQNIEDQITLLREIDQEAAELELPELESAIDRDASLRLLMHYATSITHQRYHETEIITVRVAPA